MGHACTRRIVVSALVCFSLSGIIPVVVRGQEIPSQPSQQTQSDQNAAAEQKTLRIEETQVTGECEQEHDYRVDESTTATKTDTPLRNTPQAVQVIERQVIEDRQIIRLSEVAENVSGVRYAQGYGGLSSADYYVRGFSTNGNLRNGFRDFVFISPRDVANVERIEFLKGPASILYGLSELGGTVNTITKQSLSDPYSRAKRKDVPH
jgi:iron complex outermembrane receptor protein